jgi:hypothetical protein
MKRGKGEILKKAAGKKGIQPGSGRTLDARRKTAAPRPVGKYEVTMTGGGNKKGKRGGNIV